MVPAIRIELISGPYERPDLAVSLYRIIWLQGQDSNLRLLGYEPSEDDRSSTLHYLVFRLGVEPSTFCV